MGSNVNINVLESWQFTEGFTNDKHIKKCITGKNIIIDIKKNLLVFIQFYFISIQKCYTRNNNLKSLN